MGVRREEWTLNLAYGGLGMLLDLMERLRGFQELMLVIFSQNVRLEVRRNGRGLSYKISKGVRTKNIMSIPGHTQGIM